MSKNLEVEDHPIQAYFGGVDLNLSLDELITQTKTAINSSFKAIKMKVGKKDISEDVRRVKAVRKEIGDEVLLMLDANMILTVEQAITLANQVEDQNIYWLEEPIIPEDLQGLLQVRRQGRVSLACGENLRSMYEYKNLISSGAISFPQLDVTNMGGVSTWIKVAHFAEVYNLPVTTHGLHELHVHLLSAITNSSLIEIHGYSLDDFLEKPLKIENGYIKAPDTDGHGLIFKWDKLNNLCSKKRRQS